MTKLFWVNIKINERSESSPRRNNPAISRYPYQIIPSRHGHRTSRNNTLPPARKARPGRRPALASDSESDHRRSVTVYFKFRFTSQVKFISCSLCHDSLGPVRSVVVRRPGPATARAESARILRLQIPPPNNSMILM